MLLYSVTVALNHEEIKTDPQIITKTKTFINKYNCEGINFQSGKDDWKKSEKKIEQLLQMFCVLKKKKIYILLMF